jgi:hypothetical protein
MDHKLQRGAHPITLDGRERILFFDLAATWLLVEKYGVHFNTALYGVERNEGTTSLKLKSLTALQFFLWAGLQSDLEEGEVLTLEQAGDFMRPWLLIEIFNKTVLALTGQMVTPDLPPGKTDAAGERSTPIARSRPSQKASTSRKPRGSRSAR